MATIIKNNNTVEWKLQDTKPRITIPASGQEDLEIPLSKTAIASSPQLLADLANPAKLLVCNDGSRDLTYLQAASHILMRPLVGPTSSDGTPYVHTLKSDYKGVPSLSVNWCDKSTWYHTATRHTGEIYTRQDARNYIAPNSHICVDPCHAKITDEVGSIREAHRPLVRINGAEKTERIMYKDVGDYTFDYTTGNILFYEDVAADAVVTGDHSQVINSEWTITPETGKIITIQEVEAQFEKSTEMVSSVIFQSYGTVGMMPALSHLVGTVPDGTEVPLGQPTYYQTLYDFVNKFNRAQPVIPIFGGNGFRGLSDDIYVFVRSYEGLEYQHLRSDWGMSFKCWIEDNKKMTGNFATTTLYTTIKDI